MKFWSLFLGIVLCINSLYGQVQVQDTNLVPPQRWRDTCFGLLNKNTTNIPSGYLIDYSLIKLDPDKWDGVGSNDTIQEYGEFFYYNNILKLSAVNLNAALQNTDDLYINCMRYKRDSGSIPLTFLYQAYQKINVNALANNLLSITSDSVRLLDVTGRPSSPYDNKELFMFTPLQTEILGYGYITFSLPASLWQMPGITSVSIDFGDGIGSRSMSKGGLAYVYYATEGDKYITAVITTAGGTRTAKSKLKYRRPAFYVQPDTTWKFSLSPVYANEAEYLGTGRTGQRTTDLCTEGSVFDRVNCDIDPGAEVFVVNGCDKLFDRPIIIVEGFDTDDKLTIEVLINRFNNRYGFVNTMLREGHDFVFVNLTKPRDYIENNAKVLEEVINRVNAVKDGNARGVVIGYSIGGLIARWCLRDMEDRFIDHEIDDYFSYDVPHQGANLPLGLQFIFAEMENDFEVVRWINKPFRQLVEAANSPAAKQAIAVKANYINIPLDPTSIPTTLNPVRAKFAQALADLGYPQNLTRHAIALGRGDNTVNTKDAGNGAQFGNFVPGSKIFGGQIEWTLINVNASAYAVQENGNQDYIARYRFVGFKAVKIFGITAGFTVILKIRNFQFTSQNPYDDAPGSYETTQTQFRDQFSAINSLVGFPASNEGHRGHNFVATASALDLQNQQYGSTNGWQSNNMFFNIDGSIINPGQVGGNALSNTALSPFDFVQTYTSDCGTVTCQAEDENANGVTTIITGDWNLYHNGSISKQATEFLQRQILNAAPGTCAALCDVTAEIDGADRICVEDETFTLINTNFSGLNIFWEFLNGNAIITNGQGTPTILAARVSNGADILRVTLSNGCGRTRVIQFNVQVGMITPTFDIYALKGYCATNGFQAIAVPNNPAPVTYNWWVNGVLSTNHTFKLVSNFPSNNTRIELQVSSVVCGLSNKYFVDYVCGNFRLAPNPAMSYVIIESPSSLGIQEVQILDKLGILKKQLRFSGKLKLVRIDVAGLKTDVYTVRVSDGVGWTTRLLIVQK